MSRQSQQNLDWFAFFVANLQAGFGPFVSVHLTAERWTQTDIGLVLTIGGVVGLLLQVPGGALVDTLSAKRGIAAWSVIFIGVSAFGLAFSNSFLVILGAWVLHAVASCTLNPALAAISLGLVGHGGIARRLGRNASFGSLGNAIAAAAMGGIGYWISNQAVFLVTASLAVPALAALGKIEPDEIDSRVASGTENTGSGPSERWWRMLLANRPLLILFCCMALFHASNAAMLPLVGSTLTLRSEESPALFIAACIILPQAMVVVLSPIVGSYAQTHGRRLLLIIAFLVLPIRGICFGFIHDEYLLVLVQSLDGISAAILGVLVSLVVADVTRARGHFALAQGMIGTGMGLGASVSTLIAGLLADRWGSGNAFLGLAFMGALGLVAVMVAMPETKTSGPQTRR